MPEHDLFKGIFPDDFKGLAVELGAGDGETLSTTLHMEQAGWDVLCIEPCEQMYEKCRLIRKRTVRAAVLDSFNPAAELIVREIPGFANNGLVPSIGELHPHFHDAFARHNQTTVATHIEVVRQDTLDAFLGEAGFNRLDFASIDVDTEEMRVLYGFDIQRWRPRAVLIENVTDNKEMAQWFGDRGYRLHGHQVPNDLYVRHDEA